MRGLLVSLCFSWASFSSADELDTYTIPLSDVWALNMPGTREIRDCEPPQAENAASQKVIELIRRD